VSGTLTVDQSTTFNDLDFIMGAGAVIVVSGTGVVLTANNYTHFKACRNVETPRMWVGITVANGASIAFSNVTVRDAWVGLRFVSTAHGTANSISDCYLLNNMFGMGIFSQALFRPALFANNLIDRQAPDAILPPPSGFGTYTGSVLHRGIWITSSTVDLASGASGRNVIGSYRYGIWNYASTVTVANMTFDTQVSDPMLTDSIDGTGIFSWRSNLNVGGAGSLACIFEIPANSGIISRNTLSLSVRSATFDNPGLYGIRCSQSTSLSSPINIIWNFFEMNFGFPVSAIYIERPPSGPSSNSNVFISRNRIESTGTHTKNKAMVMIDVQGKVPAFDVTSISNNPIDIGRTWPRVNGIRVAGKGWSYEIFNNQNLDWFAGTPTGLLQNLHSRGIIAHNLMDGLHLIESNTISSTLVNEKSFLRAGLSMDNNPLSVRTCYNVTNSTHTGIECRGNLNNTLLTLNTMGEAAYGLYCENGNTMPDQDRQENIWTASSYFSFGARYSALSAPFVFKVDPSAVISNDKPPTFFPTSWFVDLAGSEAECGYPVEDSFAGGGISDYEQDFINEVIEPDTTAKNWDTRQRLLYKLLQLPELLIDNSSASSYLYDNQTTNSSPYLFAQAENLFDQAYTLSSTLAGQIASASAQIQTIGDDIQLLDEQQADSTTYDTVIAQQRAAAFAQLDSVAVLLQLFRTQADTSVQQGLQTALTYASALPETMTYEDNLKDILVFAIRSAQGDSLVETDFVRLRQIAAQCPSVGGISVRRAPQWLLHEEGIEYTDKDWDSGCPVSYYDDAKSRISTVQTIQISPNPANERLNVLFPEKAAGDWLVYNALGRIVREGKVDVTSLWLETQDWTPGFYFLVWKNTLGRNETVKFIVTH
jgi:hypothetical protein